MASTKSAPAPSPSPPEAPTHAAIVVQIGERVWGRNWPSGMGRLIGRSARNLQRLQEAVRDGQDYRTAPAILAEVRAHLGDVVTALKPWTAQ
jgi:hypothetical protein